MIYSAIIRMKAKSPSDNRKEFHLCRNSISIENKGEFIGVLSAGDVTRVCLNERSIVNNN